MQIPDAMGASAISNVDMAIWVVTSGGPHPECPAVCAREPRNHQVWSGDVLRHAGSRHRLRQNVGHNARGETCHPGEREGEGSTSQANPQSYAQQQAGLFS